MPSRATILTNPVEIFPGRTVDWQLWSKVRASISAIQDQIQNPMIILDLTAATDSDGKERRDAECRPLIPSLASSHFFMCTIQLMIIRREKRRSTGSPFSSFGSDGRAVRDEELIILDILRPQPSNRFSLWWSDRFGSDGMLYLGIGDGHCFECPQSLDSLHGKIIRIDVRGASAEQPYRIPEDSPLLESPDARPEIWAYGLRNPWRMAFDPQTDTLWVGDVGQNTEEEVTIATAGANLGWPIFEGNTCFRT